MWRRVLVRELKDVATAPLSFDQNSPTELRCVLEELNVQKYSWEPKIPGITLRGASSHVR